MTFKEEMDLLYKNYLRFKSDIHNEEATKITFVMPFIQKLGYNVFNPKEVYPEYTADTGLKKGEKVDFCLFINEIPTILVECKRFGEKLSLHHSQLQRYFHVTECKFAILTNGEKFRFYTDLDKTNVMDNIPFWELDIRDLNDKNIQQLGHFRKANFDPDALLNAAEDMKIKHAVKQFLTQELTDPGQDFVRFILKAVKEGKISKKYICEQTPNIKSCLKETLEELVGEKMVLIDQIKESKQAFIPNSRNGIVTTQEELDGLRIIRAILNKYIEVERITYKDVKSYFNVLFDGHINKPICRLYFNGRTKYVGFRDTDSKWERIKIERSTDLYNFSEKIVTIVRRYVISDTMSFRHDFNNPKDEIPINNSSHKGFTIYP